MMCRICHNLKLPNEFSPETVSSECEHPNLSCLRCTIEVVEQKSKCPYPGCNVPAKLTDTKLQWFQAILQNMFKEYGHSVTDTTDTNVAVHPRPNKEILTITLLTGESMVVVYDSNMEVLQVKERISETWNHEIRKQKLLFNEKELLEYGNNGRRTKLLDYAVEPNSTIYLVVMLYSVPEYFNHVVFDLYWGFPSGKMIDYLDASCLIFAGKNNIAICDYKSRGMIQAVLHTGDVIDYKNKIGHHTINVKLKELPSNVTSLFFVLSAYSSPSISKFPNPSLKFYEASKPSEDLCKTTISKAVPSQAIVMCSVSRKKSGLWEIFSSGKLTSGTVANYKPILQTVQNLISQGF